MYKEAPGFRPGSRVQVDLVDSLPPSRCAAGYVDRAWSCQLAIETTKLNDDELMAISPGECNFRMRM
jgi:hypothetical protein